MTLEEYEKLREIKAFEPLWLDLLNASGYAGVLPSGGLVDRRYYPDATPVQKNSVFGVEEPKEITDKENAEICDNIIINMYMIIGHIERSEYTKCYDIMKYLRNKYKGLKESEDDYVWFKASDPEPLINQVEKIIVRADRNKQVLFSTITGLCRYAKSLAALVGKY